jgi:plasmid stability protein
MGEMRIRIDETLLTRIESLAKAHNRSIDEEVIAILTAGAPASPPRTNETLYQAAVRIAAMTPKDRPQIDSVDILREERDR